MFHKETFPRKQCIWLSNHKHWQSFILFAIVLNCLLMAFLYDPLDVMKYKNTRNVLDIFFTFLFMAEMLFKIVAQGLLFGNKAYLKDGWNIMDGTIVWVSFVCLDFVSGGVKGLGGIRAMRGIRPLRTLSKFKSGALFVRIARFPNPGTLFYLSAGDCCPYIKIYNTDTFRVTISSDSLSALIQLGLLQDVAFGGEKTSPDQFQRVTKRAAGVKVTADDHEQEQGGGGHLKASDLKVVQALLGRSEAHPTKVLTGNEWLQYFDKVASDDESDGETSLFNQRMRIDSKTGLDMII